MRPTKLITPLRDMPGSSSTTGFFRLFLIEAADVAERLRAVGRHELADEVEEIAATAAADPKGRASVPIVGHGEHHQALRAALRAARDHSRPLVVPRPALW